MRMNMSPCSTDSGGVVLLGVSCFLLLCFSTRRSILLLVTTRGGQMTNYPSTKTELWIIQHVFKRLPWCPSKSKTFCFISNNMIIVIILQKSPTTRCAPQLLWIAVEFINKQLSMVPLLWKLVLLGERYAYASEWNGIWVKWHNLPSLRLKVRPLTCCSAAAFEECVSTSPSRSDGVEMSFVIWPPFQQRVDRQLQIETYCLGLADDSITQWFTSRSILNEFMSGSHLASEVFNSLCTLFKIISIVFKVPRIFKAFLSSDNDRMRRHRAGGGPGTIRRARISSESRQRRKQTETLGPPTNKVSPHHSHATTRGPLLRLEGGGRPGDTCSVDAWASCSVSGYGE